MVVTGDITQIDLPRSISSGLRQGKKVVEGLQGVAVVELNEGDVVRHELVGRIIKAYEVFEEQGRQEERGISE